MLNYIIRRMLHVIPIILGTSFVFFLIFNVVGGSDKQLYNVLPQKSRTAEGIEAYREAYGLNDPLVVQYINMVQEMVTFDFGRSLATRRDIKKEIKRQVPASIMLTFPAFTIGTIVALCLALFCAFYRGRWPDIVLTFTSVLGMATPLLAIIIIGQYLFAYKWQIFPLQGFARGGFIAAIPYLILPWILWVVASVGPDIRFYRNVLLEEVNRDYVRTARAKGASQARVMFSHVLPNAMIPILTYLVISLPFLLTGSLLLESFFSIPGMGSLLVSAVVKYDFPVLKATVMVFTLFFVFFSLLTDILYAVVDPRIKLN